MGERFGNDSLAHDVMDSAVNKTRAYTGTSLAQFDTRQVRVLIDKAIKQEAKQANYWWEEDRVYGLCHNMVVRIDEHFAGAERRFSALLRKSEEYPGRMAVISVVDDAEVNIAVRDGRWVAERPAGKEPKPGTLEAKIEERLGDPEITAARLVVPPVPETEEYPPYAVFLAGDGHQKFYRLEDVSEWVQQQILAGVPAADIVAYRRLPLHIAVSVDLGEGE